ncbi:MAG: hypothetical protein HY811_03490 [Planctomycetes bacterium]|nr:hypothetical protein [Planctomycetota bacterium]
MREDDFKPKVKKFLKGLGIDVRDIPSQGNGKTPDFSAKSNNDSYTIELKIKGDDVEETGREKEVLERGEILEKSIPIEPRNTLSGIVDDGVKQMKFHDRDNKTYHILWIHSAGQDPKLHYERFKSTLFGTGTFFSTGKETMICYYFNESAFYKHRNSLDGVILSVSDQCQLCVNTLSSRKDKFRQSDLYKNLSNALLDPDAEEDTEEGIMIADCDIDRKHQGDVVKYLQKKYNLSSLVPAVLEQYSCVSAIPNRSV